MAKPMSGVQQHSILVTSGESLVTWTFRGDATVLDDYALTTNNQSIRVTLATKLLQD